MAARAHAVHDYSFAGASERPRRHVWLRDDDDEVVLPRGRGTQVTGALVLSAVLASALVAGAAYAVYSAAPPELSQAPAAAPLLKEWQPDPALTQANIAKAMQGPAIATPAVEAPMATEATADVLQAPPVPSREREVILDDSAPGFQETLPQPPTPNVAEQPALTQPQLPDPILPKKEAPTSPDSPYPNPTTTPPEMSQPPADSWPDLPKLDTQNPY
jgi:hypothetical protein